MNITLNNRQESFYEDNLTISEIMTIKNFTFRMLVVKVNGKLVKKTDYSVTKVVDGDDVHILHMISGG